MIHAIKENGKFRYMEDEAIYEHFLDLMYRNKPEWTVIGPITGDIVEPIEKKEKVMSTVKFMGKKNAVKSYSFKELDPMTMFRIVGHKAIYLKVGPVKHTSDMYMLEVATGKMFVPTFSPVELVSGEVLVYEEMPDIY